VFEVYAEKNNYLFCKASYQAAVAGWLTGNPDCTYHDILRVSEPKTESKFLILNYLNVLTSLLKK
jgi:hypothetical protein